MSLIGLRSGRLEVVASDGVVNGHNMCRCKCDCGGVSTRRLSQIKSGVAISCGCMRGNPTHKKTNTRLFRIWQNMRNRCYQKKSEDYPRYGERGIVVCYDWHFFTPFYTWSISNGYSEQLTLDRIDNDGDYTPSNCQWSTAKEQARNRSSNRVLTYLGKSLCVAEWAERLGVKQCVIYSRLGIGWSIKRALTTPSGNPRSDARIITYRGVAKTIQEWARANNVNVNTYNSRYQAGWTPERIIETPIRIKSCGKKKQDKQQDGNK